jgi:hypothetical protein
MVKLSWRARGALTLLLALPAACSTPATTDLPESPVASAVRLAAGEPRLAALADTHRETFQRDGGGWVSPGYRAAAVGRFDAVGARLPGDAAGAFEIGLSRFERFRLRITLEEAEGVPAYAEEGCLVYADAYPSTDLVWTADEGCAEELLLLRDAAAPRAFTWHVELPSGIAEVRPAPDGGLLFADRHGEPVLHAPAPFAIDAQGVRRDAHLRWDAAASRLSVELDREGLAYPVLLDPALENVVWQQRFPAVSPPARYGFGIAYDSLRSKTVLFGGSTITSYLNDTWEWDGVTWSEKKPTVSPPAGSFMALAVSAHPLKTR